MKKILSLFLSLIIFASLNAKTNKSTNNTIITGHIENSKANMVELKSMIRDTSWTFKMTNGQFKGEIKNALPGIYLFKLGNQYTKMYLSPGDSISIILDTKRFDASVKFLGTQAAFNNYWAATILLSEKIKGYNSLFGEKPKAFITKSDSLKGLYLDMLEKYQATNKLSKQNVKLAQAQIKYDWATAKIHYFLRNYNPKKPDSSIINHHYFAFVNKSDLSQGDLMQIPTYRKFIWVWLHYLIATDTIRKNIANKGGTYHPIEDFEVKIDLVRNNFHNTEIKNFLNYKLVRTYTMINGNKGINEAVKFYKNQHPDKYHLGIIQRKYAKWAALEKGKSAPGFAYESIDGKTVSLKDLRGKYVYIDVWATWCGPCRGELPYLKKLETKFEGKNISFVSISIDANKKAWEKMVHDKKLTGIQLCADNAGHSKICTEYLISGIPRFILINPQGNLIDANAARPSGDISKQIAALLK